MKSLLAAGLLLSFVGFALVLVGSLVQGGSSVGGAVFIGPFPIVFGSGSGGWQLALTSLLVGAVMACLMLLWGYRFSRTRGG
ncbi:MAG: DUF131 domain-containing protein [Nitrososphaerota archaeon]|nr:DUF131 domain-containing protein [Nitrososphaerota archaeon]MDG6941511.1 DUF131 domain-containing protein [Nitrososphaerota archaeon]MDG6951052.1 DUF131 domain-containing protein [Nitrososphaerota archaeon]